MMMEESNRHVILHVGMPKTATSSFNSVLRARRTRLSEHNLSYPRLRTASGKILRHSEAAWALSSGIEKEWKKGRDLFLKAIEGVNQGHSIIFISEDFNKYACVDPGLSAEHGFRNLLGSFHEGTEDY